MTGKKRFFGNDAFGKAPEAASGDGPALKTVTQPGAEGEPAQVRYHVSRYADEQLGDKMSPTVVMIHNEIVGTVFSDADDDSVGHEFQGGLPLDTRGPRTDVCCFHGKRAEDGVYDVYILWGFMADCGEIPEDHPQEMMRGKTVMMPMPMDVPPNYEFRLLKADKIVYLAPVPDAPGADDAGAGTVNK